MKELFCVCLKTSWMLACIVSSIAVLWFIVSILYLHFIKKVQLETATELAMESLTRFLKRLEQFPKELQMAQTYYTNPEISFCIQYYKIMFKCWMYKQKLL